MKKNKSLLLPATQIRPNAVQIDLTFHIENGLAARLQKNHKQTSGGRNWSKK
jgi:hypothetical protein